MDQAVNTAETLIDRQIRQQHSHFSTSDTRSLSTQMARRDISTCFVISFVVLNMCLQSQAASLPASIYDIPIYYLSEKCEGGTDVKEITKAAHTGLVFSHKGYGREPYTSHEPTNCIISIAAQRGYKLRLTALEFSIAFSEKCIGDSLTMFDHDQGVPNRYRPQPGTMLSKVCGGGRNNENVTHGIFPAISYARKNILAESKYNLLTLWWHRAGKDQDKGFKLMWTAFKDPMLDGSDCDEKAEFTCLSSRQCIDRSLVCDTLSHCIDNSDTDPNSQLAYCGQTIGDTGGLHGVALAAACAAVIVGSVLCCVLSLICYRSLCPAAPSESLKAASSVSGGSALNTQEPNVGRRLLAPSSTATTTAHNNTIASSSINNPGSAQPLITANAVSPSTLNAAMYSHDTSGTRVVR